MPFVPAGLLAFVALFLIAGQVFAVNFTVSLDRDSVSVGENVNLTLTYENGDPATPPSLPGIQDLVIDGPMVSRQFTAVNGSSSSSLTYTYTLTPRKPGVYVIPALAAKIGDQQFTSQPIQLHVTEAGKPQSNVGGAFLKLVVAKKEAYVGEIVPVEFQLYFQAIDSPEMPHLNEEGFTLGKIRQQGPAPTSVNGTRYQVVYLKTCVVAVKTGDLNVGPATMDVKVPRAVGRDWFGRQVVTDWQQVTLQSEPATLQVSQLPHENVPAGFSGAVGNYSMNMSVTPTNIAIGDPLTIKVEISGQGAIDNVTLPAQTNWQQFKLYPPTAEFQPSSDDPLGMSGVKTFSLTAVPQSMDIHELPPFVFSYFDPEQRTYRTLSEPAVPLVVRPSAASLPFANYSAVTPGDNPAPARDIAPIKQRIGDLAQVHVPVALTGWYWTLQSVPALAWVGLLIRRKQKEHLANNPRLRREREVHQIVHNGLNDLRKYAAANQGAEFFATMFHLLQEQIGERLDVPASAITESVLEERLRLLRLPEEQMALLQELFQVCNQARYSPQSTNAEMMLLIPKVERAINELRKVKA